MLIAFLSIVLICFDGSIVSDTITHILNVVTYLTNTDFSSIQVIKGFVDLFNKVIDFILSMEITETAVKYLIAQQGVFVCRHKKLVYVIN